MKTKVVNMKKSPYDIYIGRNSKYGSPFRIGEDGDRQRVVKLFEESLMTAIGSGAIKREYFEALQGRVLGCFCKPLECHGDVLVRIADNLDAYYQGEE